MPVNASRDLPLRGRRRQLQERRRVQQGHRHLAGGARLLHQAVPRVQPAPPRAPQRAGVDQGDVGGVRGVGLRPQRAARRHHHDARLYPPYAPVGRGSAMKNWDIDRRNLLKSLGIGAACLPILRSSKVWADTAASKRMLLIHNSEGYILNVVEAAGGRPGQRHLPHQHQGARGRTATTSPGSPTWTSRTTRKGTTGPTSATASSTGAAPRPSPATRSTTSRGARRWTRWWPRPSPWSPASGCRST